MEKDLSYKVDIGHFDDQRNKKSYCDQIDKMHLIQIYM